MQYRNLLRLAIYVILGAIVFLTNYLQFPLLWVAVISGIVVIAIPVINQLEKMYDRYVQQQKKSEELKKKVDRYIDRISELGFKIKSEDTLVESAIENNIEPTKESVYQHSINVQFEELEAHRRNIIHTLLLCREINLTNDPISQAGLKGRLSEILSSFDFVEIDEPTLELLSAYDQSRNAIEQGEAIEPSLFTNNPDNLRELSLEFVTSYGTTDQLAVILFSDKERSEELRRTLGKLIARGRLSTKSVNRETAKRIQAELEEIGLDSTKYIVFTQRMHYHDSVEQAIEKFPHMRVGTKHPDQGFPEEIQYMRMYIVYPEFDYGGAENFLKEEIKPSIPDGQSEGFISIMPLHLRDLVIYPEPESIDEFLSGTYETLSFLKTGQGEDVAEIVSERLVTEIGISRLLATIPFNVMVPDMGENEKELIIENYEKLKSEFGVNELFDWADVDAVKLGEALSKLDEDSQREKWVSLAEDIVAQAQQYDAATYGGGLSG